MDVNKENPAVGVDAISTGSTNITEVENRSVALQNVSRDSPFYNIRQDKRGYAIIFSHEYYDIPDAKQRECAPNEAKMCKDTFENLNFEVFEYPDLTVDEFTKTTKEISKKNELINCDCLVVIFASHGQNKQGNQNRNKECICEEYICLKDGQLLTSTLWQDFTGDKCTQMAGKPKLFFIQACRGKSKEDGILMECGTKRKWKTDGTSGTNVPKDYVIPMHSDMLMMWSSYPGTPAFRDTIQGSYFLNNLCKVLLEKKDEDDLFSMLMTVTREVAINFKATIPDSPYNNSKTMPYIVSTLMRKVFFGKQEQNPLQ